MQQAQLIKPVRNALALALAACAGIVLAQAPIDRAAVEAQYRADRQACLSGDTMQDTRAACLYDARLAREAALEGRLGGEPPETLASNQTARCETLRDEDQLACLRLMNGEGWAQGSVEEGVIVRELVTEEAVAASGQSDDA